jgi:hypothetical protein
MAGGDVCTQTFSVIANAPIETATALDLPASTVLDCCFTLPVLATASGVIDAENDQSSFLVCRELNITLVALKLDKWVNGAWGEVTALTNDDYGTNYAWQFYQSLNPDGSVDKNYIGYKLDWQLVLNAFSSGTYRIRTVETPITGSDINNYSNEWCLNVYTADRANGTVRLSYIQNGIIGDSNNFTMLKDYANLDWFNQMRIPAFFGLETASYEREFVEYTNRRRVWIADQQEKEFSLNTKRLSADVHNILKTDVLQADTIIITDYNKNNAEQFVDVNVRGNSDYEPQWNENRSKLASVELKFILEYNNYRKKRC